MVGTLGRRGIGGVVLLSAAAPAFAEEAARPRPVDLGSGVQGVDLIPGNPSASEASEGDAVRVLLKGRLFAKQGWVFTDDYKEGAGLVSPHEYVVGSGEVIRGLEIGVVGMREGGVRRVVIPPAVSYQDKNARARAARLFEQAEAVHDHLQSDPARQRRGGHAEHGGVRHRARAGAEAGMKRVRDATVDVDVSARYGARARRRLVREKKNQKKSKSHSRAPRPLPLASGLRYELHPQMYVSR